MEHGNHMSEQKQLFTPMSFLSGGDSRSRDQNSSISPNSKTKGATRGANRLSNSNNRRVPGVHLKGQSKVNKISRTHETSKIETDRGTMKLESDNNMRYELGQENSRMRGADASYQDSHLRTTSMRDESISYDQQSYDEEEDSFQRGNYPRNIPHDQMHANRFQEQQNLFNSAIQEKIKREKNVIVGSPYYEIHCRQHKVYDDPDDLQCTFQPKLYAPLGSPKGEQVPVDPLQFRPVKNIKHPHMTKSSIEYHTKRLYHARQGPQVYRPKLQQAGGSAFYQKIACEGPESAPYPQNQIEGNKKKLNEQQLKAYNDSIRGNDDRFNLIGGTFKGAFAVKANLHSLNVPDQGVDMKRFKQKDLLGRTFDSRCPGVDQSILEAQSKTLNTKDSRMLNGTSSISSMHGRFQQSQRQNQFNMGPQNGLIRRSIETKIRHKPFSQMHQHASTTRNNGGGHYSKATIAERFANKGIRNRATEAKTVATTLPHSRQASRQRNSTLTNEKSMLRSQLNNQSQMSDAFGVNLVLASIENSGQNPSHLKNDLIRGVPKFVDTQSHGLQYAKPGAAGYLNAQASLGSQHYQCDIDYLDERNHYSITHLQHLKNDDYQTQASIADLQGNDHQRNFMKIRDSLTQRQQLVNKFQEEWYPEGIDPDRHHFIKSSIKDHQFNPHRTFNSFQKTTDPNNLLITKLFTEHNDSEHRQQARKINSDLHNVFKERAFNVVETQDRDEKEFGDDQHRREEGATAMSLFKRPTEIPDSVAHPNANTSMSPCQNQRKYTLVQNTKKQQIRQENPNKKKAAKRGVGRGSASSQDSGGLEFINAVDPEHGGIVKKGADSLNLPHGFYNLQILASMNVTRFPQIYARYKKQSQETTQVAPGAELASEQMQELAQEMLESDQMVDQAEDETFSLSDLKDIPFADFLVLHKIFPKIFLLEMDSKSLQTAIAAPSKQESGSMLSKALIKKQTLANNSRLQRMQTMSIQKALNRRHQFYKQRSMQQPRKFQTSQALTAQNIKMENQKDIKLIPENSIISERQNTRVVDKIEKELARVSLGDGGTILEQSSSMLSEDFDSERHSPQQARNNITVGTFVNTINSVSPAGTFDSIDAQSPMRRATGQVKKENNSLYDDTFFMADPKQSNQIPIQGNSRKESQLKFSKQNTTKTSRTQRTVKLPVESFKLTSYESCLQKYTGYIKSKKYERCEALIKQGKTIFPRNECLNQFNYNLGVLKLAQQNYDSAIDKYLELYRDIAKDFLVRPPASRIEGNNEMESLKFAILTNLIIAYMMREMIEPNRASQQALYELLRNEKLLHVRFTQSTDELNLFKLATYVKQFIKNEQHKRYMQTVLANEQSSVQQSSVEKSERKDIVNEISLRETDVTAEQIKFNTDPNNQVTTTSANQDEIDAEENNQTDSNHSEEGEEAEMGDDVGERTDIDYENHFKKQGRGRATKAQVHPLYTREKKMDFLNRFTPKITMPEIPADKRNQLSKEGKKLSPEELEIQRIKEISKEKELKKQKLLESRIQKVMGSIGGNKIKTEKDGRHNKNKQKELMGRLQGSDYSCESPLQPMKKVPVSEADSIFDDQNLNSQARLVGSAEYTVPRSTNQDSEVILEQTRKINEQILERSMEEEAKELGVDLSALYSHKKPKSVLIAQERLVMDVLKLQTENKEREQKYKNMAIKNQEVRKTFHQNEEWFKQMKEKRKTETVEFQLLESELKLSFGGNSTGLGPKEQQYLDLVKSITLICKEPNIEDIILNYIDRNEKQLGDGKKEKQEVMMQVSYSAALEVLVHATKHLLNKWKVSINAENRAVLIKKINQIKEMFQEELNNPQQLISKSPIDLLVP